MNREQASNVTMIMAVAYLCYSTSFLNKGFKETESIMKVVMAGMYIGLGINSYQSTKETLLRLSDYTEQTLLQDPASPNRAALKLKS
jgi:ABC-type molybdenum transport system ATPase subunit/photorepair protein PhrA